MVRTLELISNCLSLNVDPFSKTGIVVMIFLTIYKYRKELLMTIKHIENSFYIIASSTRCHNIRQI
jgi:uncharacterized protein YebE (UPF0316 family)